MVEPEKPFACAEPDCGMTFTNEDHLHVHTKKHDMVLQLGMEQKTAFVADQTPTPTRFIRNCEEVGLFQDLNVNPFDEGFKRAMEIKSNLCLEGIATPSSDDLHTPQMAFPLIDTDSTMCSSTNNQRNVTISRSSSDESGAVKEYETTTISKLTNEVTTISRLIGKQDPLDKNISNNDISRTSNILHKEYVVNKDIVNEKSVLYKNNVIKIHNDLTIQKDGTVTTTTDPRQALITQISYTDSVIKDANVERLRDAGESKSQNKVNELIPPPVMSQKSLDLIVESLTAEMCRNEKNIQADKKTRTRKKCNKTYKKELKNIDNYEVTIKLPNGKRLKLKPSTEEQDVKPEIERFIKRVDPLHHNIQNTAPKIIPILPKIPTGTLIPVKLVTTIPKIAVPAVPTVPVVKDSNTIKATLRNHTITKKSNITPQVRSEGTPSNTKEVPKEVDPEQIRKWESHSAASKRYRYRLKQKMDRQAEENRELRAMNDKLKAEKALLKMVITQHMRQCPLENELRALYEKLS